MNYTDEFDIARKLYPGVKRGLETEFNYFRKTHKDWKKVIPFLKPAIAEQIKRRKLKKQLGAFVPPWKHFKTWVYNRCWEEEEPVIDNIVHSKKEELRIYIEKEKKRQRELCEDWLKSKSTPALLDLKKDGGYLVQTCGWLIDEILETRKLNR